MGFDALGDHTIRMCSAYKNRQSGVFNGAPKSRRVLLESNREYGNRGLPPDLSCLKAAQAAKGRGGKGKIGGGGVGGDPGSEDHQEWTPYVDERENLKWLSR